ALADAGFRRAPVRVLAPESPPYDGAALAALPPLDAHAAPGLQVLVLRGEAGSDGWIETLRARGARVDVLAAYRNEPVEPPAAVIAALHRWLDDDAQPVRFVVTQSSAVARLDALLARAGLRERAMRAPALAIHPRIVCTLRDIGWRDVRSIEPGEHALGLALESASDSSSRHGV
ncbi:MAG TPA: uroporphyrinogen-III synthase, partial [Zeimonas sp.]